MQEIKGCVRPNLKSSYIKNNALTVVRYSPFTLGRSLDFFSNFVHYIKFSYSFCHSCLSVVIVSFVNEISDFA